MIKLHHTYTERNLKYIDLDKDIFDEDYKKEVTLFGLFQLTRGFKLRNDVTDARQRSEVNGFKKK
jgi:hypothetical protein